MSEGADCYVVQMPLPTRHTNRLGWKRGRSWWGAAEHLMTITNAMPERNGFFDIQTPVRTPDLGPMVRRIAQRW